MNHDRKLREQIERQARRMQKAEREQPSLFQQAAYLGTLGLVFVLPVLAGLYLGHWLDERLEGYSIHWTVSLLILGLIVGLFNAYSLVKGRD